jgi:hypothetical protein
MDRIVSNNTKQIWYTLAIAMFFNVAMVAKPLTIINSTGYSTDVHLTFSMTNTSLGKHILLHKKIIIGPDSKFVYELHEKEVCEHMMWEAFGNEKKEDENTLSNYTIAFKEALPQLQQGGSLVISRGGSYIYDNKQGKKNSTGFGKASKVGEV